MLSAALRLRSRSGSLCFAVALPGAGALWGVLWGLAAAGARCRLRSRSRPLCAFGARVGRSSRAFSFARPTTHPSVSPEYYVSRFGGVPKSLGKILMLLALMGGASPHPAPRQIPLKGGSRALGRSYFACALSGSLRPFLRGKHSHGYER